MALSANAFRKSWALTFLTLVLLGNACHGDSQAAAFFRSIQAACPANTSTPCTIDLSDIVQDIDWDRIAFVKMQAWADHPAQHVGVNALEIHEFEDVIVFAKDQTATRTIRRQYHPEVAYRATVFLADEAFKGNFAIYARSEARFTLKPVGEGLSAHFELLPTN